MSGEEAILHWCQWLNAGRSYRVGPDQISKPMESGADYLAEDVKGWRIVERALDRSAKRSGRPATELRALLLHRFWKGMDTGSFRLFPVCADEAAMRMPACIRGLGYDTELLLEVTLARFLLEVERSASGS